MIDQQQSDIDESTKHKANDKHHNLHEGLAPPTVFHLLPRLRVASLIQRATRAVGGKSMPRAEMGVACRMVAIRTMQLLKVKMLVVDVPMEGCALHP